jgi:phosphoserine phosphatase
MTQVDGVNVFDFDGTLIRVNSFWEINKRLLRKLISDGRFSQAVRLTFWYLVRKSGIVSHLFFKKKAVAVFEDALNEQEKTELVRRVFEENVNANVHAILLSTKNCVVSTSAPYAHMSRLDFGPEVKVIAALDPNHSLPDETNWGAGKLRNVRAHLIERGARILSVYTDSLEDQPLIDAADRAYIVRGGRVEPYK